METISSHPAKTPTQIQDVLLKAPESITDTQLLVLVLGRGTTRHGKGQVRKTGAIFELASALLAEAGGRLEHLVAAARRADFDRRHFGLGKTLGSRLIATLELAHRWREQAIKLHLMFEALCENREWAHPAQVLGEPVAYRGLLSIAETRIERVARPPDRTLQVNELLKAAELAATRAPATEFAETLLDLGISDCGLEDAIQEVRRLFETRKSPATVAVQEQGVAG